MRYIPLPVILSLVLFTACTAAIMPTSVPTQPLPTRTPVPTPLSTPMPTPTPEWGIAFAALMLSPEEVSAPQCPTRLYMIRPDESDLTQLTEDIEYLAGLRASPDGKHLLFVAKREDTLGDHDADYFDLSHLYILDIQSGEILTLTSGTTSDEWLATWSPDGRKIAFVSSEVNTPCSPCPPCYEEGCTPMVTEYHTHLYVMNGDGTGKRKLTPREGRIQAVSWSPKGEWIAFEQFGAIWAIRPDGSEWHKVADAPIEYWPPYHSRPFTAQLAWSPDGSKIAFAAPGVNGNADIFIANPDGYGLFNVTHHPAEDFQPTWSPDGKSIAFVSKREGNWAIYVQQVEGDGIQEAFYSPTVHAVHPAWSPNGLQVAFTAGPDLWKMHLFVLDLSRGRARQLSDMLVIESPVWISMPSR